MAKMSSALCPQSSSVCQPQRIIQHTMTLLTHLSSLSCEASAELMSQQQGLGRASLGEKQSTLPFLLPGDEISEEEPLVLRLIELKLCEKKN